MGAFETLTKWPPPWVRNGEPTTKPHTSRGVTEAEISLRHVHPEARAQLAEILRRTIERNRGEAMKSNEPSMRGSR